MSSFYIGFFQVRKQVQTLRMIISGLQAKAKDRQWLKNQTSGELDDTKLIEGKNDFESCFIEIINTM